MTPIEIVDLMLRNDHHPEYTENQVEVSSEFLCGKDICRIFKSPSLTESIEMLIQYFNEHVDHESMVGKIVEESGWPNFKKVETYLDNKNSKEVV